VENALLKSSSLFPYFMLVAFEAGGLLRAMVLVFLYPFVCVVGREMGLKIMVMTCFLGIKASSFRVGRSVLPKFLLEDVGSEMFEMLKKGGKQVGVSRLPRVMVESFLREYLEIDLVVGGELKTFCGYYLGLMENIKTTHALDLLKEGKGCSDMIGIISLNNTPNHEFFSHCKVCHFSLNSILYEKSHFFNGLNIALHTFSFGKKKDILLTITNFFNNHKNGFLILYSNNNNNNKYK